MSRRTAPIASSLALATATTVLGWSLAPASAEAQTLRGSRASIDRMYRQAVAHDLHFYQTTKGVRDAVDRGRFERLTANADLTIHQVSFPYVTAPTKLFVERLASQYRSACGEQLVVTSAIRPDSRQPANSTERSVHPTGMAIDLRRPTKGSCLRWLRTTLLALEKRGVIEATEERRPPHFHVAVFPSQYSRYVNGAAATRLAVASAEEETTSATPQRYQVRRGDTLWHIARRYRTSVRELRSLNGLRTSTLRPGQTLLVPTSS